jgi:drug/metabolite transporter (DMT)-like permease
MWDARGGCCGGWCPIRLAEAVTAVRTHARLQVSPALAGLAFTLASAVFMSGLGVTTQLAFDAGAPMGTLLSGRFLVAAVLLWPLVLILRPRRPDRAQIQAGLLLGLGYSAHAWLFSESLARLDAGLVDLLLFTYPALVMLGAIALGRERWSTRGAIALGAATAGTSLVLVGGLGSIDAFGAALALASAVAYTAYILTSAGQLERTDPFLLTALVTTGAAITLTVRGAVQSDVSFDLGASAFALIAVVGLVAVAGMGTFVAGIRRLGPSRASIVSAVQPALTPVLGFLAFADRLRPAQVLGGALVVTGVVVLEARGGVPVVLTRAAALLRPERRTLARLAAALDVPAGSRLLRHGTPAEAFFVIERGRASVSQDDRHIRDLGAGDFFGELGLLGDGRRTASVVAATDMRLRVIPEREFEPVLEKLPKLARTVREAARDRLLPAAPRPVVAL